MQVLPAGMQLPGKLSRNTPVFGKLCNIVVFIGIGLVVIKHGSRNLAFFIPPLGVQVAVGSDGIPELVAGKHRRLPFTEGIVQ